MQTWMIEMLTGKLQGYILYMHFLLLMNLPSVSNFNSPFKNSWSKKLKSLLPPLSYLCFLQPLSCSLCDQPWSPFHRSLIQSFPTDFILLGPFLSSYIIQFSHAYLLKRSWQLKLLKL